MMRSLLVSGALITAIFFSGVQAQCQVPGHKSHPDAKWEVRKEYDEQGNLIYYDSTYIESSKHFGFHGPGKGQFFEDFDSLFGDLFNFQAPHGFSPFSGFPDSIFPDAFLPFEDFFPPSFNGPDVFFQSPKEWLERFREGFSLPEDSINQLDPKWQQGPGQQKKPARVIKI